jgi:hypothetical protein
MSKILMAPILLLISSLAFAQEKVIYDANAEKRSVGSFQTVRISDGIDLYLTGGNEDGVVVSAKEVADRNKIMTVVEDGELKIYFDRGLMGWNWKNLKLKAYVAVKSLKGVKASGGCDVFVQGTLNSTDLSMKLSGGSDFTGNVAVTNLAIEQSGGSDVRIKGNVVNLKVDAGGGSDFKGAGLSAEYAIIMVSGGSDATLTVTKELAAEASGGSDVNYYGNPVIKYKSASGGGSVTKRN